MVTSAFMMTDVQPQIVKLSRWAFGAKMTSYLRATSSRRIDVNRASFLRYVPAGIIPVTFVAKNPVLSLWMTVIYLS